MISIWQRFRAQKPRAKIIEVEVLVLMLIGGLLFAGGKISLDQTNTIEFFTSCHVPHEFVDTMIRKFKASNDVFQHFMGIIDTPEKFEARRLELAKRVWLRMKESDSRECRNCHDAKAMDPEKQGKTA